MSIITHKVDIHEEGKITHMSVCITKKNTHINVCIHKYIYTRIIECIH